MRKKKEDAVEGFIFSKSKIAGHTFTMTFPCAGGFLAKGRACTVDAIIFIAAVVVGLACSACFVFGKMPLSVVFVWG